MSIPTSSKTSKHPLSLGTLPSSTDTPVNRSSTLRIHSRTPQSVPRQCPHCGALLNLCPEPPFSPVISAIIDHLVSIEDSLSTLKRLVEEAVL